MILYITRAEALCAKLRIYESPSWRDVERCIKYETVTIELIEADDKSLAVKTFINHPDHFREANLWACKQITDYMSWR